MQTVITEAITSTFDALGYHLMARVARSCVDLCPLYAGIAAATIVTPPSGAEQYAVMQAKARAVSAGNALACDQLVPVIAALLAGVGKAGERAYSTQELHHFIGKCTGEQVYHDGLNQDSCFAPFY
jgi:hypothetical protein